MRKNEMVATLEEARSFGCNDTAIELIDRVIEAIAALESEPEPCGFCRGLGYIVNPDDLKRVPCYCQKDNVLAVVDADVLSLTHGGYRLYLLGKTVSAGEYKELDVVESKLIPVTVTITERVDKKR